MHALVNRADERTLAQSVGAAIDFVAVTDPRAYRRLCIHVERIIVLPMQGMGRGAHVGGGRQMYLDETHVRRSSSSAVAATIVHESTHAFLAARGAHLRHDLKRRVESRCQREAKEFLAIASRADAR